MGYLYFGLLYGLAEILAIPATPLTASSGYLFGLVPGVIVVLISATIAAAASFAIGRSVLRDWTQDLASKSTQWRAIDKAVSKDGVRVVLLLRLSLAAICTVQLRYALTSIRFWPFICTTFLGFAPGTFGIVYAGTAGKAIFGDGGGGGLLWYTYVGGAVLIAFFAQTVDKVATDAIREMEMDVDVDVDETEGVD